MHEYAKSTITEKQNNKAETPAAAPNKLSSVSFSQFCQPLPLPANMCFCTKNTHRYAHTKAAVSYMVYREKGDDALFTSENYDFWNLLQKNIVCFIHN